MPYTVTGDEVTVHATVSKLPQPDGSFIYQNGMGETYYRGDVIDDDMIAEDWKEALESGEGKLYDSLSQVLEQGGDKGTRSEAHLGLPFDGYDDMEEDDVLAAMRNLPSAAVTKMQEYEANRDEPRARIVNYNVGYGENSIDRQEGKVGSDVQEADENKASARLTTREEPEEGLVTPGEGVTGTGDPQIAYGSKKDEEKGDIKGTGLKATRRGRRDRQPKPPEGGSPPSIEKAND